MSNEPVIKLFGSVNCHKTKFYIEFFEELDLPFQFLDVIASDLNAKELRALYKTGRLNFPTITIGEKKLRNPSKESLLKWINKLLPESMPLVHDKANKQYTMNINGALGIVKYEERHGYLYLTHSEVPYDLRGMGLGKVMVLKVFEKLTEEGFRAIAVCSFIKAVAQRSSKWNQIIK